MKTSPYIEEYEGNKDYYDESLGGWIRKVVDRIPRVGTAVIGVALGTWGFLAYVSIYL